MGIIDKIKGNHADTNTAGTAYDQGSSKHSTTHGAHGTHGTHGTHGSSAAPGVNTTGAGYAQEQPYPTHQSGVTGSHHNDGLTGRNDGVLGSHKHDNNTSTLPGGAAYQQQEGYAGQDGRGPGAYNTTGTQGYGDNNTRTSVGHNQGTHGGVLGNDHHSSNDKGLFGRKKDDLETSLTEEQKAKAELDAAMARHEQARQHAAKQLTDRESAAEEELRIAQQKVEEARERRRLAGH